MIGSVTTKHNIPAGAVVYYDDKKNTLVIFDGETGRIHVMAMPFVVEGLAPDPRVRLP